MSNLAPWFILLTLAAVRCANLYKAPWTVTSVLITLTLFSSVQLCQQYLWRRDDSLVLPAQTSSSALLPVLNGVLLQKEDIVFYEAAQKILFDNGYKPGDYLLSLYDFPAIVYVMNAISPGQSWYIGWPERDSINAFYFKRSVIRPHDRFFLVLNGTDPRSILFPQMKAALNSPALGRTFVRIGKLPHPRSEERSIYFYKAKE